MCNWHVNAISGLSDNNIIVARSVTHCISGNYMLLLVPYVADSGQLDFMHAFSFFLLENVTHDSYVTNGGAHCC